MPNARAQRRDHGANFFVAQHLVVARLLDVQNLSLERQDRLEAAITSLLRGSAGGFTLDQVQLATLRLAFRAVCQLAGQAAAIERTFAAGQIAGLARCFSCARSFDRFVDDLARDRRVLLEERAQLFVDERLHGAGDVGVQLALGLSFKLRLRQLHADDSHQTLADVVAREVFFHVLEQAQLLAGVVDGAGQRGAETGKVRAAIDRVDVVGETENVSE